MEKIYIWIFNWITSWIDMFCGLISILTFTLYRPWWDFSFRSWGSKLIIKWRIKNDR